MTLWQALEATAAAHSSHRAALIAADGEITLPKLVLEATSVDRVLRDLGVGAGDRVLVALPNSVRYAAAYFGVLRRGGVVVPVDPGLTAREVAAVAERGAAAAIVDPRCEVTVRAAFADARVNGGVHVYDRPRTAELVEGPAVEAGSRDPDDTAVVFFTSGTTGDPKGVTHSHRSLVASVMALERLHHEFFSGSVPDMMRKVVTVARYGGRAIRAAGKQTWFTAIPFSAIGGNEVLLGSLLGGHTVVTAEGFHPRRAMEALQRHKVNVFPATPSMVSTMLDLKDFESFRLPGLLVVGLGGGPATPELVERIQARFGCCVTVGYGSTELGGGVLVTRIDDSDKVKQGTVGRPFPGTEVRIVDEHGVDVPVGDVGELICRAVSLMAGYADLPSDAHLDADGWYHTNDLAAFDRDGNIRIAGRKDDLIIRGGNKIRPLEVERVLEQWPEVEAAAVVGIDTPRVGQQVWAFVVPRGAGEVDREQLMRHCRANLAPFKVPDHVRLCDSLPTTTLGKVQRHRLIALAKGEDITSIRRPVER
ncbi:MAG TPA: class I adenylate-forming enzyme family protein [Acidimicrobiales bacterium]|nr:class I adenylate-forming enzyme family protein [Acidimicrobiales bacterium]